MNANSTPPGHCKHRAEISEQAVNCLVFKMLRQMRKKGCMCHACRELDATHVVYVQAVSCKHPVNGNLRQSSNLLFEALFSPLQFCHFHVPGCSKPICCALILSSFFALKLFKIFTAGSHGCGVERLALRLFCCLMAKMDKHYVSA